jgi:uncharacterized protein Yka (UPF0111/DUF47 family)
MSEKIRIIDALGERALLLPALVNAALSANDRVKYLLTLLQTARQAAEHPGIAPSRLKSERIAAGVRAAEYDEVVAGASQTSAGQFHIPLAARIVAEAWHDVDEMLAPLTTAQAEEAGKFGSRLGALHVPDAESGLDLEALRLLTSGDRASGDSLHLLVMDMHKALNRLQAGLASESIAGCQVYGIEAADRPLVEAFMLGVNATAPLKFGHPGLAATATRVGEKLVLQNDIGTTDAHVLVLHVSGRSATVTYTDVHLARLEFFQNLFAEWKVHWEDTRSRRDAGMEDGLYHLCVGRYRARSTRDLRAYLQHLGSRLVFLIDWNRARKRLRLFVPRRDALGLLRWAAAENLGHMGFLAAGGENLVYDAMRFAFGARLRPGARLDNLIGDERAVRYLQFVLRAAATGLLQGRPAKLIADEARAALAAEARSAEDALLESVVEHASLIQTLAASMRATLDEAANHPESLALLARRAKEWESAADSELISARDAAAGETPFLLGLLATADDIADELEDAAFNLSLAPVPAAAPLAALAQLAEPVALAAQELVKALLASAQVRHGAAQADIEDFLEAVHRIQALERKADQAQRAVKKTLLQQGGGFSELFPLLEAAQNLEEAADGLMRVALTLRGHALAEVGHA